MKRIGRYLITAAGLMTLGGAPSLFAGDFDHGRGERREVRRERRDFRRYERRYDRDDFYRYRFDHRYWR